MSDFTMLSEAVDLEEYAAYEEEQKRKRAEELGAPLLEGLAFWVPPLTDVFIGNSAYVWYRLLQFTGDADLEIEPYDGARLGEPQTWFEEYADTSNFWYDLTGSRYDGMRGLAFGLEEGIAPGQPFLMRFGPPHWSQSGWEVVEYDCEYDYEIVRKMPRHRVLAGRSFERAFAIQKRYAERRDREREQLRALQRKDIKAMFFEQDSYYVNGGYSSFEIPTGKQVALCSTHVKMPGRIGPYGGRVDLVYGKHPDSWELAFTALYAAAEQVLGFKKEQLHHLPKKWRR